MLDIMLFTNTNRRDLNHNLDNYMMIYIYNINIILLIAIVIIK